MEAGSLHSDPVFGDRTGQPTLELCKLAIGYELIDWQELFTNDWVAAIGGGAGALAAAYAAWISVKIARSVRDDQAKRERVEADVLLRLIVPEVSIFAALMRVSSRNLARAIGPQPDAIGDRGTLVRLLKGLSEEQHPYLSEAHGRLTILPEPLGPGLAAILSGCKTMQRMARMICDELGQVPDAQIYSATNRLRAMLDDHALMHIKTANACRKAVAQDPIPEDA